MSSSAYSSTLIGAAVGASCTVMVSWMFTSRIFKREPIHQSTQKAKILPEELREEQFSRHTLYFGDQGMSRIRNAKVCVVGLGGVGSHTAMMLARGGVQTLRLIDFDQVTLSSLNRHACATLEDVGIPKVFCVKEMCAKLGVTNVDARVAMYTKETGDSLLAGEQWDLVIDCIDDVPTKGQLLLQCLDQKIRVLSCMGAGGKADMTRLHISDLRTASRDPLASKLRQTMKRIMKTAGRKDDCYLDDMDQLSIIYSSEKTVAKLADLTEEQKKESSKAEFGAVDGMRIRVLPVLGPLPAIMGQSLASIALCELGNKPIHQPIAGPRVSNNVKHKILQRLKNREANITKGLLHPEAEHKGGLELDQDDVEYLYEIWRNKCAVTKARVGTVLELVRWDLSKPPTCDNLVLMGASAMKAFDEKGLESIPFSVQQRIEERLYRVRTMAADVL